MEKSIKLLKKQFNLRIEEDSEHLFEALQSLQILKPFYPSDADELRIFLKLCSLTLSYHTYPANQIIYNSLDPIEKHQILFILIGKVMVFRIKKQINSLEISNDFINENIEILINKLKTLENPIFLENNDFFNPFSHSIDSKSLVIAISQTTLETLSLEKDQYEELFLQKIDETNQKLTLLTRLFPDIPQKSLLYFGLLLKPIFYDRHAWVFKEGDLIKSMFLIKEGELKVYKNIMDRGVCISVRGAGDLCGIEGIFNNFNNNDINAISNNLIKYPQYIREYSLQVNSLEGAWIYKIDIKELLYVKKELENVYNGILNMADFSDIFGV